MLWERNPRAAEKRQERESVPERKQRKVRGRTGRLQTLGHIVIPSLLLKSGARRESPSLAKVAGSTALFSTRPITWDTQAVASLLRDCSLAGSLARPAARRVRPQRPTDLEDSPPRVGPTAPPRGLRLAPGSEGRRRVLPCSNSSLQVTSATVPPPPLTPRDPLSHRHSPTVEKGGARRHLGGALVVMLAGGGGGAVVRDAG